MEIERKFLVDQLLPNIESYPGFQIEQGYLSFEPEVRFRKKNNEFFLTVKLGEGLTRFEKETRIHENEYHIVCTYIKSKLIIKKRYVIPLAEGLYAELDIYDNHLKGLIVVEVEFETEEQANAFDKPAWFGSEITYDRKYNNKNLSQLGKWDGAQAP